LRKGNHHTQGNVKLAAAQTTLHPEQAANAPKREGQHDERSGEQGLKVEDAQTMAE